MNDISNKTIVALLAVALIITVIGTVVSVNQISGLKTMYSVGGATTAQGLSTLEITSNTEITNQEGVVSFGLGYVDGTCSECVMNTDGLQNQTGPCCRGFNNVEAPFVIENTGNNNISLSLACTGGNCSAENFTGGTNPALELRFSPNSIEGAPSEVSPVDSVASCNGGWLSQGNYIDINASMMLCGDASTFPFSAEGSKDAVVMDINISIPADAAARGESALSFTFTATSS